MGNVLWDALISDPLAATLARNTLTRDESMACIAGVMAGAMGAMIATGGRDEAVKLFRAMADNVAATDFSEVEPGAQPKRPQLYVVKP